MNHTVIAQVKLSYVHRPQILRLKVHGHEISEGEVMRLLVEGGESLLPGIRTQDPGWSVSWVRLYPRWMALLFEAERFIPDLAHRLMVLLVLGALLAVCATSAVQAPGFMSIACAVASGLAFSWHVFRLFSQLAAYWRASFAPAKVQLHWNRFRWALDRPAST